MKNDLVKIYFVISTRDYDTGNVDYDIKSNLAPLRQSERRIFGTGHYNFSLVCQRLKKCQDGLWFSEQRADRQNRSRIDTQARKTAHRKYLASQK